jgi:hypothetical protein
VDRERKVGYELRFENEGASAGFDCIFHESGIFEASEEDDFRRRAEFLQAAGSLKAVHDRHHDVEHENVGLQTQRRLDCLLAVKYGANYLELGIQKPGNCAEDLLTVIGQQNSGLFQRSEFIPCLEDGAASRRLRKKVAREKRLTSGAKARIHLRD